MRIIRTDTDSYYINENL